MQSARTNQNAVALTQLLIGLQSVVHAVTVDTLLRECPEPDRPTPTQVTVLRFARERCDQKNPPTMTDLARFCGRTTGWATGAADRLEKLGLLERSEGGDRREKLLALTARGTALLDKIEAALAAEFAKRGGAELERFKIPLNLVPLLAARAEPPKKKERHALVAA